MEIAVKEEDGRRAAATGRRSRRAAAGMSDVDEEATRWQRQKWWRRKKSAGEVTKEAEVAMGWRKRRSLPLAGESTAEEAVEEVARRHESALDAVIKVEVLMIETHKNRVTYVYPLVWHKNDG